MEIRKATEEDAEVLSTIIGEIEEYYGGSVTPGDLGQIRNVLFGERPAATVLLARDGADVVGLASYSLLWPAAGADTSMFLKELFVRATARRKGVARVLMAALHEEAASLGCSRIEWAADTDNPPALALYEALGVVQNSGKVFYRSTI